MSGPWANEFPPTFDVGTPGAGHMHFDNDGSQTLYGPDGTTVLYKMSPANGLQMFNGGTATFLGTDGGSIQVESGVAGNNPAQILWNVLGIANPASISAGIGGPFSDQGTISLDSPSPTGAVSTISLTSQNVVSNRAAIAAMAAGGSGLTIFGRKPSGGAGSAGLVTFSVLDDGAVQRTVQYEGTALTVEGNIQTSKFVQAGGIGAGLSYIADVNSPNNYMLAKDPAHVVLMLQGKALQAGNYIEARSSGNGLLFAVRADGGINPGTPAGNGSSIYNGSGVPNNALGSGGDFYFRWDNPGVAGQRLYVKNGAAWVATAL